MITSAEVSIFFVFLLWTAIAVTDNPVHFEIIETETEAALQDLDLSSRVLKRLQGVLDGIKCGESFGHVETGAVAVPEIIVARDDAGAVAAARRKSGPQPGAGGLPPRVPIRSK